VPEPGYCPHGNLPDDCVDCRTEAARHEPAETFTAYDREKLAAVEGPPPPVDFVIRLLCTHPGCQNAPRPGLRNCREHRTTEPVTLTVEVCEYVGDVEGLHDHGECVAKLAEKGRTVCRVPGCWDRATVIDCCAIHSAAQVY
jgi:hypothetical protein